MQRPPDTNHAALAAMRYAGPALIAALVFVCFLPALNNDFVNWDDEAYLVTNFGYRGLTLPHLKWMFTTRYMSHYQPLTWLTHALVYTLWGLNPTGYHLTNVVLHAANAVLLYFLIIRLLRAALCGSRQCSELRLRGAATVGALFFALHPLRVEAVAWATAGSALCASFLFATLIAYLRMHDAGGRRGAWWTWYLVSTACFVLSLLSRASGMMLPIVLLILDIYPLRRLGAEDGSSRIWVLVEKIPFAALALAAAALVLVAKQSESMVTLAEHGIVARAMQTLYGLCFYLWKTVAPFRLSALYPLQAPLNLMQPRYIVSAAAATAITVGLIRMRQRYPWGLTAWACYVVILLPVLGIAQAGPQIAADRYTYFGCLPWAVLVAAGVYKVKEARLGGFLRPAAFVAMAATLALFATLTFQQTRVWKNSLTLWNSVLQIEPGSFFAYINRGNARQTRGDLDGALADYNEALRLQPDASAVYNDRGTVRRAQGDAAGALADFTHALQLNPDHANAYANRGNARQAMGDLGGALADFNHALRLNPEDARTYFNRGNARKAKGDLDGALADYGQALRLDPQDAAAYNNRGRARQAKGDLDGALADYGQALRLTPAGEPVRATFERNLAVARQALAERPRGRAAE